MADDKTESSPDPELDEKDLEQVSGGARGPVSEVDASSGELKQQPTGIPRIKIPF